ncbi:hypothetical protein HY641_05265 [Candidatus Woesearchaeota archaeon]|nr:hypothetical protein [Candidatus Woesearchaeota archaeon]
MDFSPLSNTFFLIIGVGIVVVGLVAVIDIISGISIDDGGAEELYTAFGSRSLGLYDDFPEYSLNRSNVADAINYNPSIQEILRPYKKIGFHIGLDRYTLHLVDGKYYDLTVGVDADVDFAAQATREQFNTMVRDARHRDIGHLIATLVTLDVPMSVKTKALAAVTT